MARGMMVGGVEKHDFVPYKYGSVDNKSGAVAIVRSGCDGCCSCGRRAVCGGCSLGDCCRCGPQEVLYVGCCGVRSVGAREGIDGPKSV